LTECVKVAVGGGEGKGGEVADEDGGEFGYPVDVSTGYNTEEGGDGGRAERAVVIGDKAGKWEGVDREQSSEG
jgi:hypothetical protein